MTDGPASASSPGRVTRLPKGVQAPLHRMAEARADGGVARSSPAAGRTFAHSFLCQALCESVYAGSRRARPRANPRGRRAGHALRSAVPPGKERGGRRGAPPALPGPCRRAARDSPAALSSHRPPRGSGSIGCARADRLRPKVYADIPAAQARAFVEQGARVLHVVDLDAAFGGTAAVELIGRIAKAAAPALVQVGGGIRDARAAEENAGGGRWPRDSWDRPRWKTPRWRGEGRGAVRRGPGACGIDVKDGRAATEAGRKREAQCRARCLGARPPGRELAGGHRGVPRRNAGGLRSAAAARRRPGGAGLPPDRVRRRRRAFAPAQPRVCRPADPGGSDRRHRSVLERKFSLREGQAALDGSC